MPYGMQIVALAAYAPPFTISNDTIAARLRLERFRINKSRRASGQPPLTKDEEREFKTSDRWIKRFIGFEKRRFVVGDDGTADLAIRSAQLLQQHAGLDTSQIDAILFGTVTPSYLYSPPDACLLHEGLGIRAETDGVPVEMFGLDGSLACSTWPTMLRTAYAHIRSGLARNVLLIGADAMSRTINWGDRAFATVLGDAGTALWCRAVNDADDWFRPEYFWSWMSGEYAHVIDTPKGGSRKPLTSGAEITQHENRLRMDGRVVKEFFVPFMSERGIDAALSKAGLQLSDIDLAAFHEANRSQINGLVARNWAKRGFRGTVVDAGGQFGNTTSASIPLTLALNDEYLTPGSTFVWAGFGGGFTASLAFGQIKEPIRVVTRL